MPNLNFKTGTYLLLNDPHHRKLGYTDTSNLEAEDIFLCLPGLLETRDTFIPLLSCYCTLADLDVLLKNRVLRKNNWGFFNVGVSHLSISIAN